MTSHKPKLQTSSRSTSHRSTSSLTRSKTEVLINVYDLLPSGTFSSLLWQLGSSLLHTGLVIPSLDREYAFGGHNQPHLSGVYWTKPRTLPPGGRWRCELLQGFSFRTNDEIEDIISEAGKRFLGTSYSLLSNNCNHFTTYLCEKLVGKAAPGWLNRAASIGIALPCVVPKEWIAAPDADTMDGELVDEADEDDGDERTSMLRQDYRMARDSFRENSNENGTIGSGENHEEWKKNDGGPGKGKGVMRMPETESRP